MGGKSLARGVLLLFLIPKGNEFSLFPFLLHFFHKNMEFLWNFGYIKIGKSSKSGSYFIWKVFYLILTHKIMILN